MPLVTYAGPHARCVIDGIVLQRGGPPVELTEEQVERLWRRDLEVHDGVAVEDGALDPDYEPEACEPSEVAGDEASNEAREEAQP